MKSKPKLNKSWHEANRMPFHPTTDERIECHLRHQKHCGCRPIPEKLKDEMIRRGIKLND